MRTIADANCENNFVIGGDHYYDGDNDYHDGDAAMSMKWEGKRENEWMMEYLAHTITNSHHFFHCNYDKSSESDLFFDDS